MTNAAPLGVYIHWPYCARICPYCDFNVVRDRGRSQAGEALTGAIAADLAGHALRMEQAGGPGSVLGSIYFGGGTPSLMRPEHVALLIGTARRLWPSADDLEVTLEANPADADHARFADLADAGVNRLSLGVQAFDDTALRFLKRDHDAAQARRAMELAVDSMPRVSFDLIYALPDQTPQAWAAALDEAAGMGAGHLSAYQLTVEAGTPLARAAERGAFRPVDEEGGAAFYATTVDTLAGRGFEAYEVSNFARGTEARSRHNLIYWRGHDYVGVGPGAHGRVRLAGGRTATEAEAGVDAYVTRVSREGVGWSRSEVLQAADVLEERVLMGLRIDEGVALGDLEQLGRAGSVAPLVEGGWLAVDGPRVIATAAGRLVLDSVTGALLA